ncbi:CRISPR-associated protein [Corynebacterium atypicum]|uniref:CRISPR-associated protein n=1 Tax=Corynebacterium atypicum TaxID=191610 RepID=A0ABM5QL37_9CORY|nr:type I-E CRISPR-associated protein Cas5/CasD [Corynebacterium atypicum]AIG63468.1 CRISPR-associated protein [Corynebacterium atypicum]
MTSSVFLRLSGPLQSWAGPAVTGNYVHTGTVPTATALRGLIAGALGCPRDRWPEWLTQIEFTVRSDKRARIVDDFHTIGSREDEWDFRRRLAVLQGLRASSAKQLAFKPGVGSTVIARRTYLADAEFLVRITHEGRTEEIDQALAAPRFSTYLGRKAFAPAFPFYLGVGNSALISQVPAIQTSNAEPTKTPAKVGVDVHHLSMGDSARPSIMPVPVVADRASWFAAVERLKLVRRATV